MSVSLSNFVTENIVYYYGLAFVLVATAFKESSGSEFMTTGL